MQELTACKRCGSERVRWGKKQQPRCRLCKRIADANARARYLKTDGVLTVEDWRAICERFENRCACCGVQGSDAVGDVLHIDHVIPMHWHNRGGSNGPENIQPLCQNCNRRKKDRPFDYRPEVIPYDEALAREIEEGEPYAASP